MATKLFRLLYVNTCGRRPPRGNCTYTSALVHHTRVRFCALCGLLVCSTERFVQITFVKQRDLLPWMQNILMREFVPHHFLTWHSNKSNKCVFGKRHELSKIP